ncbi:nitrogen regulatory protein P-II family /ammonium transporter [Oscillibacter sp. PC13]|uniref:ammonium transporter n=1 Tax=Oscillibacter sp. PC13 TaxID=1855299 RepID=UPI0008E9C40D|nr:ammonium transporter [Oscillibacter sp. PC13]SFP61037.1 nitrogen regulatory protein P-II family /ammonium transporter [Oscillibacter sp. PC13]
MYSSVNTIWVLLGAALVFLMQAGFAMCEAGFTRAKNTGNILMKNLMDFCIGTPTYWILGFGLMFAGGGALIGGFDPFVLGDYSGILPDGVPLYAYLIFQTVFCATSATIVSGSMAERTKFISYCIYSFCISAFIYPISGHWIWGGGWLAQMGFHDFAGSTAVHMVGGVCACIGAAILGPRIGKYDKDGKPRAIIGHNLSLGALGVFILWFCWFGFNGASTVSMTGDDTMVSAGLIFVNTNMAAAVASCVTMIYTWLRYKKPDVGMTLNAALAGLVAITAGCDAVSVAGAAIIGIVAGLLLPISVNFFDAVLKIDDPVGAISVHGVCGAAGTLLTGLFAVDGGVFYGGGFHYFLVQCIGVLATAAWAAVAITIVFLILKHTIGLRVSAEEEVKGLDITEHGLPSAYGGFAFNYDDTPDGLELPAQGDVPVQAAVPVEVAPSVVDPEPLGGIKLTKVDIICKMERFDALKRAMFDIGITGMTAVNAMGCGEQRGKTEGYFRGAKVEATMLPSIQVSIVISKVPVSLVVNTARKVLYTGNIGDGKIFIYHVENVIKVRTGEQGYDALQDAE